MKAPIQFANYVMAEILRESSNSETLPDSVDFDYDDVFAELLQWEDQLKDVDFDFCDVCEDEEEEPERSEELRDKPPSKPSSNKHGGHTPC